MLKIKFWCVVIMVRLSQSQANPNPPTPLSNPIQTLPSLPPTPQTNLKTVPVQFLANPKAGKINQYLQAFENQQSQKIPENPIVSNIANPLMEMMGGGNLGNFEKNLMDAEETIMDETPLGMLADLLDEDVGDEEDVDEQEEDLEEVLGKFMDTELALKKVQVVKIKEKVSLTLSKVDLVLSQDIFEWEYLVLLLSGEGTISLSLTDPNRQNKEIKMGKFDVKTTNQDLIVPIETEILKKYLNYHLRVNMTTMVVQKNLFLEFDQANFFVTDFQAPLRIKTKFLKNYKIRVNQGKMDIKDDSRIQFIVKTVLKPNEIKEHEKLKMFINLGDKFPNNQEYQLRASGNLGIGLIKTIRKSNKEFCQTNCSYSILVNVQKLDDIVFLASSLKNGVTFGLKDKLEIVEELEPGETLTYAIKTDHLKKKGYYLFKLIPLQNQSEMFIHPDSQPENLQKYDFRTNGNGIQSVVITQQEIFSYGFSGDKFYISFAQKDSSQESTFKFIAQRLQKTTDLELFERHNNVGVVSNDEFLNYKLDLFTGSNEVYEIDFKLTSKKGNADIYIKECEVNEKCTISKEDLHQDHKLLFLKSQEDDPTKTQKEDNLRMNINCRGVDPFEQEVAFQNDYKESLSCKFAVAIHGRNSNNKFGVLYQLIAQGNNVIKKLNLQESNNIIVQTGEIKNYKFEVKIQDDENGLYFKVISLSGDCTVYFSEDHKYPHEGNNLHKINVSNFGISSINTKFYSANLQFKDLKKTDQVMYVAIKSKKYCVLDIYGDLLLAGEKENFLNTEKLKINKLTFRQIDQMSNHKNEKTMMEVFYKNFYFEFPEEFEDEESFDITLSSDLQGLFLCVQENRKEFDFDRKCDYESTTEALQIKKKKRLFKKGTQFAISIQLTNDQDSPFVTFPIEFDILIHAQNQKPKIELLSPGTLHSKKVDPSQKLVFEVDLNQMKEEGLIGMTTHSFNIEALVTKNLTDDKPLMTLNSSNYGFKIVNSQKFKKKYCTMFQCKIYITISNQGQSMSRLSLYYIFDDQPIRLKDGQMIYVPNFQSVYFASSPKKNSPISFSFRQPYRNSVAYGRLINNNADSSFMNLKTHNFLNEINYEYKTNIDKNEEIVISEEKIEKIKSPIALFYLQPKSSIVKQRSSALYMVFDELSKVSVQINTGITNLNPYNEIRVEAQKNSIQYYKFVVDQPKDITLFLTIEEGSAQIYINKGGDEFPTSEKFWKKGSKFKNKDISILKEDFVDKEDMVGSYIIGVVSKELTTYSLLMVDSHHNMIHLEYQKIGNFKLDSQKFYFFNFFDVYNSFTTYLYSDDSDLEVTMMNYDSLSGENFLEKIKDQNENDKTYVYKKGNPPWDKLTESGIMEGNHFILRIRALDREAKVDLAIYSKLNPLMVDSNQRILFALDQNQEQIFELKMKSDHEDVDLDFKTNYGHIKFYLSNTQNFQKSYEISESSQKFLNFKRKGHQQNDIVIFDKIFLKIQALEMSNFSFNLKPKEEFKQMRIYETEIAFGQKDENVYYYFEVDQSIKRKAQNLVLEVNTPRDEESKIEFLFNSKHDLEFNDDSPFLPMPILDKYESSMSQYSRIEFDLDIKEGDYIIKLPKGQTKPLKLTFSMNQVRKISVNGLQEIPIPRKFSSLEYMMYVGEPGEFRLLLETDEKLTIKDASFKSQNSTSKILFNKNLVQEYPYYQRDEERDLKVRVKKILIPVKRSQVKSSGLLRFSVFNIGKNANQKRAYMISEFRPKDKELILKDYIDYYPDRNQIFTRDYQEKEQSLSMEFQLPQFKDQLQSDYPKLKRIKVEADVYLIDGDLLPQYKKQGLALALNNHNSQQMASKTLIPFVKHSESFKFSFQKKFLEELSDKENLMFMVHLRIYFYENQQEEYDITLDTKFTAVPYFFDKFENPLYSASAHYSKLITQNIFSTFMMYVLYLVLIGSIILCIRNIKNRKRDVRNEVEQVTGQYMQNQNNSEGQRLEMVDIQL